MNANQLYILDSFDNIVSTDENWDPFAAATSAVTSQEILGKCIWEYISQEKVKKLYKRLFKAVRRSKKQLSLAFRCDGEKCIRFMQMTIEPLSTEFLKVCTSLIKETPRKRVLSSPIIYIGISQATPMCSSCNRIFIPKIREWIEIDSALERGLTRDPLSVKYDLCNLCEVYIEEKVSEANT